MQNCKLMQLKQRAYNLRHASDTRTDPVEQKPLNKKGRHIKKHHKIKQEHNVHLALPKSYAFKHLKKAHIMRPSQSGTLKV